MRDNHTMHLLIPFSFCSSEACRQALPTLRLPNLEKLLRRLMPEPIDAGAASSRSPPHERALARALNLQLADGLIPWAAWYANQQGLATGAGAAWAFITPCHWQTGSKQVAMDNAKLDDLNEPESRALMSAMLPFFEEDGIALIYDQSDRWLAQGELLRGLASASLDRVRGCSVADWLPGGTSAIALQRLQSEMQMLLHEHPVNEERAGRAATLINSFWISGSGALPPGWKPAAVDQMPRLLNALREPALNQDWRAWCDAWQLIDRIECAAMLAALKRGEACQLTLCGERGAQIFSTPTAAAGNSFGSRFKQFLRPPAVEKVLQNL